MLNTFDWIRRCQTGAELIALMDCMTFEPDLFSHRERIGPPVFGIGGPCVRCWVYPRATDLSRYYCKICHRIVHRSRKLGNLSRLCMVVWGFLNRGLEPFGQNGMSNIPKIRCFHQVDNHRFLLVLKGYSLKNWLSEILLYHGSSLKGLLILFPTTGKGSKQTMGDALCRAISLDTRLPMDRLRVQFFSHPLQLNRFRSREEQGILTFEASDFLSLLEMAAIFRAKLRPDEQNMVREAVNLTDPAERRFFWGRLMNLLNREAKDMLTAWKFRQWPENRIKLLYELMNYAPFTP